MTTAAHIIVKGLVQGVGFRYFVSSRARQLGLKGFTRNLYSGDVEIVAEGSKPAIEELIGLVRIGPRAAQVTDLVFDWLEPTSSFSGFEIR